MVIENWHKIGWVSWLLCKIGRHDYEYEGPGKCFGTGLLKCFYCEQMKSSTNSSLRKKDLHDGNQNS